MKQKDTWINKRLLLFLTLLGIGFIIYDLLARRYFNREVFTAIYVGKSGMTMQLDNFGWLNYDSLWVLWPLLSLLFLVQRFWHIRMVEGRNGEEFVAAYPLKRRDVIRKDIGRAVFYPFYVAALVFVGIMLLEGIAVYFVQKGLPLLLVKRPLFDRNLLCLFWEQFLGFLLLMLLEFLLEVIMKNRYVACGVGAFLMLVYNGISDVYGPVYFWPERENFETGEIYYDMATAAGVGILCLLIGGLLFWSIVHLYEKRELSENGLFYFPLAKDIFLCLAWLPVLWLGGFFGADDMTMAGRLRMVLATVCGMLVFNYLVLAPGQRRNRKKLCLSAIRPLGMLAVAVAICYAGVYAQHRADMKLAEELQDMQLSDEVFTEEADAERLRTRESRSAYFDELRGQMPGMRFPDVEGDWQDAWGSIDYLQNVKDAQDKVCTGILVGNSSKESRIYYGMSRCYGEERVLVDIISPKDLTIVEDETYGRIYCTTYINRNRVTVCRYDEQNDWWDVYTLWGSSSYEEMIEDLHTYR